MFPGKAKRGATLAEVLVSGALLLLILTALAVTLVYSRRYLESIEARMDLQAACLKANHSLINDLAGSNSRAVDIQKDGISFPSYRDMQRRLLEVNGILVWQTRVAYYLGTTLRPGLLRSRQTLPTLQATDPVPVAYGQWVGLAGVDTVTVAQNIRDIQITRLSTGGNNQLDIQLTAELFSGRHRYFLELKSSCYLRN